MGTVLAKTYLAKFTEVITYKSQQFFHINQTENEALFLPEPKVWNDLFANGIGSALYILLILAHLLKDSLYQMTPETKKSFFK